MIIEIFKTNVDSFEAAEQVRADLLKYAPALEINFDLDDCDRILRVKGLEIIPQQIIRVLNERQYLCEILD